MSKFKDVIKDLTKSFEVLSEEVRSESLPSNFNSMSSVDQLKVLRKRFVVLKNKTEDLLRTTDGLIKKALK